MTARGGPVLHHTDDHGPGHEAPKIPDQTVPGTLADKGSPVCRPYGETHHPTGDEDQGDRTGAGRHAAEAGRRMDWLQCIEHDGPAPGTMTAVQLPTNGINAYESGFGIRTGWAGRSH